MSIRFAKPQEIESWNRRILANPDGGNVFQGLEFSQQKEADGWTPRYILNDSLALMALEKSIPGLGKLWYLPKGPGVTSIRELDDLLPQLSAFAKSNGAFAVKIEPEILKKDETLADLMKLGLQKVRPIQPNFSTVRVDISDDLEAVLMHLNQKGRHAIRRAERDGVVVKPVTGTDEEFATMYKLLEETAAGSFQIRSFSYYKSFWKRYIDAGLGRLFFAYVDDRVVAGAFAIAYGKKGTYKDGASTRARTVYGASHLLQWHVIQWMKEKGVTIHDLCGAPPSDQINNPDHPHYGIGRFKTNFNKEVTDYVGAYDIVLNPIAHKLWVKIGQRLAFRFYHHILHKSFF